MVIKVVVVVILFVLLRHYLAFLKPHWPVLVGLAAGALVGWWSATFMIAHGATFEAFVHLGCPQGLIRPVFAAIGAIITAKPVAVAIRDLFPAERGKDNVR